MRDAPLVSAIRRNALDDGPGIRTVVFFKGCPLSCVWCQNPETQSPRQEIVFDAAACVGCGACEKACGQRALRPRGAAPDKAAYPIDRGLCDLCGACVSACPTGALALAGTAYEARELLDILSRDAVFYGNSGGGVTFSGGEPTLHPEFLESLLEGLNERDIHVCLETCGYCPSDDFLAAVLPHIDLVYFDLKFFDSELHKRYCGADNAPILRNFEALCREAPERVLPRIPLIPGITATTDNLTALRDHLKSLNRTKIGLLPYNPLWIGKPATLGKDARYRRSEWMTKEEKAEAKEIFSGFFFDDF